MPYFYLTNAGAQLGRAHPHYLVSSSCADPFHRGRESGPCPQSSTQLLPRRPARNAGQILNMGKEINFVFPNRLLRCVTISLCRRITEICSALLSRSGIRMRQTLKGPRLGPLKNASEPHAMRASRRRPDSKPSNSKHRGARKANFQKRDGNGMDVD